MYFFILSFLFPTSLRASHDSPLPFALCGCLASRNIGRADPRRLDWPGHERGARGTSILDLTSRGPQLALPTPPPPRNGGCRFLSHENTPSLASRVPRYSRGLGRRRPSSWERLPSDVPDISSGVSCATPRRQERLK
ncbi:hypothetical protein LX32DRAFT_254285 [Colletotrichum zoysiae]|uniref:Secreted protein n=1 Tax=Colletotrichum zoysiae TaxID=1216348 RepID=A0AAD9HVL4_9PEZI|nr:hypothetical protein LX32DRAFT_254285 [Colletotrichum zoysiae]